ncbi:MAG: rhomboid family intramembrane serine protease [Verrucomicrobiota bacterium]
MRVSRRKESLFTRSWSPAQRVGLLVLIGVQAIAFLGQTGLNLWDSNFVSEYLALSDRGVSQAYAWQFFTALFLHHGVLHFAVNLLLLYLVGRDLEVIIGQRQFLFLYFFGAFAGELGHLFLMPSEATLFAASGGVAAVMMAYATILPELEMTTLLLFVVPVRLKLRWLAQLAVGGAILLVAFDRSGNMAHSALLGGAVAGWIYAHLLGFGRVSFLQRRIWHRRAESIRRRSLSPRRFLEQEIDPLLEKISAHGMHSLSRRERRLLVQARERMLEGNNSATV